MDTGSPVARATFHLTTPASVLALMVFLFSGGVQAQTPAEFSDVVIFSTNSIDIKDESEIVSGEVVVNNASPGPTLVSGVELNVRKKVKAVTLRADSIKIAGEAVISGDVYHNNDLTNGGTIGGSIFSLTPPVFDSLPVFKSANPRPEALDVNVAAGASVDLDSGDYGDIVVAANGIVVFTGGIYSVLSITGADLANFVFQAPTEVRVVGRFKVGKTSLIGDPNAGVSARDIIFYVSGFNGDPGNPSSKPAAVDFGDATVVSANFYAPNGRIHFRKSTAAKGAFLAQDVHVDKKVQLTLDSFFSNRPPVAFPKDVNTEGAGSVDIIITGSDPEGGALTFLIDTFPTPPDLLDTPVITQLDPTSARVTYIPFDPAAESTNDFFFTVTDPQGLTSTAAQVRINPPGDPTPPIPPLAEVVASDQLCDSINPVDCLLETVENTAITLILTGAAPCDPTGAPDPDLPCDGIGNDVPLTFSLPSLTTSGGGTLSALNQGTGELHEPPGADEVPQRTASVLYTPAALFTGVDSFDFQVEGDVDGINGIDPDTEPSPEVDTGTVEISVQTFTPRPPVVARDQNVSTEKNTPVDINLSGPAGTCDPTDPDCRVAQLQQKSKQKSKPQTSLPIHPSLPILRPIRGFRGTIADDTGSRSHRSRLMKGPASKSAVSQDRKSKIAAAIVGEDLFAIDSDLDELFKVDPANGSAVSQGSTGPAPSTPASLAFDGTKMYTIDLGGGDLYTLNVADGTPTFICTTGISGWQGVASDPTDEGQFYGITQSDDLYKIDRTDCTATQVNAIAGTVGGLIAALEFDANGTLWGAEFGSPGSTTENAALVTIDKTDGTVTVVSQCATRPCTGADNFIDGFQGIDFSTDGTLYGANSNDDSLYIIDTTDGSVTLLGAHGTPVFVKGLSFSEEVLREAGFTITTLPTMGTLSYLSPATGAMTVIAPGDLPLLLPSEQVTYMPPIGATGAPLASFNFVLDDGFTSDTGTIDLYVMGDIIVVDPCVAAGRPPGCTP